MRLRRLSIPAAVLGTTVLIAVLVGGLVAANGAPPTGYQTVTTLTANSRDNRVTTKGSEVLISNLSARLTNGREPVPTVGATIVFSITPRKVDHQPTPSPIVVCTAVTDSNGVATCSGTVDREQAEGVHKFTASFAGTPDLAPSTSTGRLHT